MSADKPVRLPTIFKEKVWGCHNLSPWYPNSDQKIGEVWFEADLPLLVKFIFTTERLSVQVHPDDAFAAKHENSLGKTEMWYVLRAEPDAQVALGLRESITSERLREAALSGEIEGMLRWVSAKPGDAFFTQAGTIHAIGSGLAMCEIQQMSDITYRLYDYGRPRELHLDKAVQVSSTDAGHTGAVKLPVECKYFHTESMEIERPIEYQTDASRFHMLIFLAGNGRIAGEPFRLGEAWLARTGTAPFSLEPDGPVKLLRTWVP